MPENKEPLTTENTRNLSNGTGSRSPIVDARTYGPFIDDHSKMETVKLEITRSTELTHVAQTPRHLPISYVKRPPQSNVTVKFSEKESANIRMLQEQCRRLCLTLFSRDQNPIHSLGFTSAIGGEGKSFLALVTARILARDSIEAVTLVECNWEHPTLHEQFGIPATPGLAEWLRGMCNEQDIRYRVDDNLTIIPAGNGGQNAVKLLKKIQQQGLRQTFGHRNELFILDLPSVITSSYGALAASLVDTAVIVVRSEVLPGRVLEETCVQLKNVPIHGIILNQGNSRIPRWIRQLL